MWAGVHFRRQIGCFPFEVEIRGSFIGGFPRSNKAVPGIDGGRDLARLPFLSQIKGNRVATVGPEKDMNRTDKFRKCVHGSLGEGYCHTRFPGSKTRIVIRKA